MNNYQKAIDNLNKLEKLIKEQKESFLGGECNFGDMIYRIGEQAEVIGWDLKHADLDEEDYDKWEDQIEESTRVQFEKGTEFEM